MPYRVALLSKFPPIEGGISSKTYWLARGLAQRGHEIHVITHDITAGRAYSIQGDSEPPETDLNIQVHRTLSLPWHIPEGNEYALSLISTTIDVINEHKIQILDSGYLVPYGVAGYFTKLSTRIPHVIRHGGSDIEKFLKQKHLQSLVNLALSNADAVVTNRLHANLFEHLTSKLVVQPAYVPDEKEFAPRNKLQTRRRLAAIGKINYHWQHKSLKLIAKIMENLADKFECVIYGQGNGIDSLKESLTQDNLSNFEWSSFVGPWEMPGILSQLDAIFVLESNLPNPVFSNLVLEAAWMGVGIITDRQDFADTYRDIVAFDKNQVLVVSPTDSELSAELITRWVQGRISTEPYLQPLVNFQEFLLSNEAVYADVLNNYSS